MRQIILLTFLLFLIACSSNKSGNSSTELPGHKSPGDNLIEYASGFELYQIQGGFKAVVLHPWKKNEVLASYVFISDAASISVPVTSSELLIKVPVKTMATMSSTYHGMLGLLDAREVVIACTDPDLIYDSLLQSRYQNGQIVNLGSGMENPVEAVIGQSPDVLMKYIYLEKEVADEKISAAGIPIAYNIEFMEEHPLGRAEWIKFTGALLGKYQMADSIYASIKSSYLKSIELTKDINEKPKVIAGSSFKGTWYMPGGKSFIAKLIQDAGGEYIWSHDSSRGGVPLSFELVIEKQFGAKIWINANAQSIDDLLNIDPRYKVLDAFQSGDVYHYNQRKNRNGGMDYHETGVVRPDLLLEDIIAILHPQLLSEEKGLNYWKKLQ